ncbi:MAG: hypothetical protein KDD64_16115 [Bdellovibrionales bacterium]|nr:hypothetical protein [Bdellovibrionales bacterium]
MTERLFLLAYSLVTLSFSLFIGPLFLLHSRGRRRLLERYGVWEELQPGEYIWLHAASLGEAQAMLPLVHRVRLRFPDKRILFTAVSVTGLEAVQEKVDEVRLLPFDHQAWFPKQCREHQFLFFGFGETEIWPSVIRTLAKRGIPIFMINGTVSQKTSSWYSLIRPIVRPVLRSVKHLFLVNSESRSALVSLGAPEDRVAVVGNTKYDRAPRYPDLESVAKARSQFFQRENPVFLLASIHPGEGEPWLDTLPAFLKAGWNVVVAPRHQERFSYFGEQLRSRDIPFIRRTSQSSEGSECSVLLLDTLGELEAVYSFSTACFLGGTFVDLGGHNPLEPAMYGCFQVAGPYIYKIEAIFQQLICEDAALQLHSKEEIRSAGEEIARAPGRFRERGLKGKRVCERLQGATETIVKGISSALKEERC